MPLVSEIVGSGIVPYFKFSHNNLDFTDADLNERVMSFNISEKEREFLTGSITVIDDMGIANKILSRNQPITVEWGLKKIPIFTTNFIQEIHGNYQRGPITCMITSSTASLKDGQCYFNASFRIGSADGAKNKQRVFNSGTVRQVITQLATEMQASVYIDFNQADFFLTDKYKLFQNQESNLKFLYDLAAKYNVKMYVQEDPKTIATIMKIFIVDYNRQVLVNNAQQRGFTGLYHYLDYATKEANIIDAELSSNNNTIGGSSISYQRTPTGQLQAVVTASDTETVEVWELSPAKIRAALVGKPFAEQAKLTQEIVSSSSIFDFTKTDGYRQKYFIKKTTTTAPEGPGLNVNATLVPNPNYNIGDLVFFGSPASPIPPQFKSRDGNLKTLFRFTSIDQTIDSGGYSMKAELSR